MMPCLWSGPTRFNCSISFAPVGCSVESLSLFYFDLYVLGDNTSTS